MPSAISSGHSAADQPRAMAKSCPARDPALGAAQGSVAAPLPGLKSPRRHASRPRPPSATLPWPGVRPGVPFTRRSGHQVAPTPQPDPRKDPRNGSSRSTEMGDHVGPKSAIGFLGITERLKAIAASTRWDPACGAEVAEARGLGTKPVSFVVPVRGNAMERIEFGGGTARSAELTSQARGGDL